jgi:hypothetical protein
VYCFFTGNDGYFNSDLMKAVGYLPHCGVSANNFYFDQQSGNNELDLFNGFKLSY